MDPHQQKEQILDALALLGTAKITNVTAAAPTARIAAAIIVDTLLPNHKPTAGSMFYHIKAEDWLFLVLSSEPGIVLSELSDRLTALSTVSKNIKTEIGGIASRLSQIANLP